MTSKGKEIKRALINLYKKGLSGKVYSYILCRLNACKGKSIVIRLTYRGRRGIV